MLFYLGTLALGASSAKNLGYSSKGYSGLVHIGLKDFLSETKVSINLMVDVKTY